MWKEFHDVFIVFSEERKSEIKASLKYIMGTPEKQAQPDWGSSSTGSRLYLMTSLGLGLVETSGLLS